MDVVDVAVASDDSTHTTGIAHVFFHLDLDVLEVGDVGLYNIGCVVALVGVVRYAAVDGDILPFVGTA